MDPLGLSTGKRNTRVSRAITLAITRGWRTLVTILPQHDGPISPAHRPLRPFRR